MTALPFDPVDPPADPPPGTHAPMMWRLAYRLFREHTAGPGAARGRRRYCVSCEDRWPCFARRLAERGLVAAVLRHP